MRATFRALPAWPYPETANRRSRYTFRSSYAQTLALLEDEIEKLDGYDVIIAGGWRESDIRLDGLPRSDAREPAFSGVEISFESRFGRLVYATDVCETWRHNVHSIALGLEALRAVDRYGVSKRGEQYAGWLALPAGETPEQRGERLVREAGGSIVAAFAKHHPDVGGDPADAAAIGAYKASQKGNRE